ncbi:hypothetical protein, partial [Streptomyces sp. NPDC003487]
GPPDRFMYDIGFTSTTRRTGAPAAHQTQMAPSCGVPVPRGTGGEQPVLHPVHDQQKDGQQRQQQYGDPDHGSPLGQ